MGLAHAVNEQIFRRIHGGHLVYNTCWEDPRCDRELLELDRNSRLVMITSAGCNALGYLLDDPAEIHCVDLNPRQNALLELKIALLQQTDWETLFRFFGTGVVPDVRQVYRSLLHDSLPSPFARAWWDRNLSCFSGRGFRRSFYWHGSSGTVAWLIHKWIRTQPGLAPLIDRLFSAGSPEEQARLYLEMEPRFLNRFMKWALRQHFTQSMLGVPKSQQLLAAERFPDGMAGYFRHCLRQVFLKLPLADNYFWKLYFYGKYTPDCCPDYLRSEYFPTLQQTVDRIRTHTASLSLFLQENPGRTRISCCSITRIGWRRTCVRRWKKNGGLFCKMPRPGLKYCCARHPSNLIFCPRSHWSKLM